MRKVGITLVAIAVLMIIGCQPPEGMMGVTTEQLEGVKTELMQEITTLKTEIAANRAVLDSLTTIYNGHIEKFHKGGKIAPKPKPPTVKPPTQK